MSRTAFAVNGWLRERAVLLRHLGGAGPALLAGLVLVFLADALTPAATAVAMAHLIRTGDGEVLGPALALGIVALVGQVSLSLQQPLTLLARARIDNAHRTRIATVAMSVVTIDVVESQHVQNLLKTATTEPDNWVTKTPAEGALGQLNLSIRYLGLLACCAVLAAWSWWLVPVLLIPAIATRHLTGRSWVRHFRIWTAGIVHHRWWQYWTEIATAPAEGKELRVFGARGWAVGRYRTHVRAHLAPVWAHDRRVLLDHWLTVLVAAVPLAAVYIWVGLGAAAGRGSVALQTAVLIAGWSMFAVIGSSEDIIALAGARPQIQAAHELERLPCAQQSPTWRAGAAPPHIRLERVGFAYPEAERPVLHELEMEIRPGEMLAIVGLNGAGKSTLTKLIAGLYRPTTGRVTADGMDITEIPGWSYQLAVVYQDFIRYHLSLAQNIALGEIDPAVLHEAVRDAGLEGVVDRLPNGYSTPLTASQPGGVDLSGGQWQQVALARALYAAKAGARVLILDEPTAHLDVRTERALFQRLSGITTGLSVVLISHRLATVRQADRIVLLNEGRIRECGTHRELIALGGQYAGMWTIQSQRFAQGYDDRSDVTGL